MTCLFRVPLRGFRGVVVWHLVLAVLSITIDLNLVSCSFVYVRYKVTCVTARLYVGLFSPRTNLVYYCQQNNSLFEKNNCEKNK